MTKTCTIATAILGCFASVAWAQDAPGENASGLAAPAPDDPAVDESLGLDVPTTAVVVATPPPPAAEERPGNGNLLAELGGGALGYIVGGGFGLALMLGLEDAAAFGIPTGIFIAGLGIAAGITIGGATTGGNGSFWAAFLGQALGGLTSLFLLPLTWRHPQLAITTIAAFPLLGGVLAYDISDRNRDRTVAVGSSR